jgi:hypothetical protein
MARGSLHNYKATWTSLLINEKSKSTFTTEFSYIICSYLRRLVIQNALKYMGHFRFLSIRFQFQSVFFIWYWNLFIELFICQQTCVNVNTFAVKKLIDAICQLYASLVLRPIYRFQWELEANLHNGPTIYR